MNQLTIKDYKDILYVLEIANSYIDLVKLRRDLLHSLVKVFNATSGVFCLIDSNFKTLDTSTYETIYMHRQFAEQYFAYYFQYDPLLLWESKKTICQTSDILSPRDWRSRDCPSRSLMRAPADARK